MLDRKSSTYHITVRRVPYMDNATAPLYLPFSFLTLLMKLTGATTPVFFRCVDIFQKRSFNAANKVSSMPGESRRSPLLSRSWCDEEITWPLAAVAELELLTLLLLLVLNVPRGVKDGRWCKDGWLAWPFIPPLLEWNRLLEEDAEDDDDEMLKWGAGDPGLLIHAPPPPPLLLLLLMLLLPLLNVGSVAG